MAKTLLHLASASWHGWLISWRVMARPHLPLRKRRPPLPNRRPPPVSPLLSTFISRCYKKTHENVFDRSSVFTRDREAVWKVV